MEDCAPEHEPEPEPEPACKPARKAQRKPKKEVPVGRNGLKKKRVVKSRMTTDDKGYVGASSHSVPRRCKGFRAADGWVLSRVVCDPTNLSRTRRVFLVTCPCTGCTPIVKMLSIVDRSTSPLPLSKPPHHTLCRHFCMPTSPRQTPSHQPMLRRVLLHRARQTIAM